MKQVSKKQAAKNRELSAIKKNLPKRCEICGGYGDDLAHLLPKSIYPEHYTNPLNLVILCRSCHFLYDNDVEFRKRQKKLLNRIKQYDEMGASRYFKL